jgi:argininosuccinate synthase
MRIIAPVRDLDMRRDEALSYARENRLITNLLRAGQFSSDENLWCRTVRQGVVARNPSSLPDSAFKWVVSPQKAPGKPTKVSIRFDNGMLFSARVNGKLVLDSAKAISALNEIGGKNGVGRLDVLDDKLVGLKVREVYECPAAQILLAAHRALESLVLTSKELDAKRQVDSLWARRVHEGYWHTRLRHSLDAFTDEISRTADGEVGIELYKGGIRIVSCESPHALYDARLSSRDSKAVFSQKEARHFAKLYGLQEVIAHMVGRG